jgi:transcriptional regulator with XRE-family HTH domain
MTKSLHTPEYKHFRSLLIAARVNSSLTQTDVSTRLGRPQSFVAKYERGERRLDVIEFIQVCGAIGVDPHALLSDMQSRVLA